MGNRKRLTELEPVYRNLDDLVENGICVVVKSLYVSARIEHRRISRAAEVQFGRTAVISAAGIADCQSRLRTLAWQEHRLRAEEHLRRSIGFNSHGCVMDEWLRRLDELQALRNRKFNNFVPFVAS